MRYRIQELLGAGGMGQVYKAWDPVLDRPVALKYLRGQDPSQTRRMLREARAQAKVAHEHVCRVYETGEIDGKAFVAMQYVDGPTLARPPSLLYRARKRMGRLERERETLGTVAAGPGSFPLGASALPLGELEEARELAGTQDGAGDPTSAP